MNKSDRNDTKMAAAATPPTPAKPGIAMPGARPASPQTAAPTTPKPAGNKPDAHIGSPLLHAAKGDDDLMSKPATKS